MNTPASTRTGPLLVSVLRDTCSEGTGRPVPVSALGLVTSGTWHGAGCGWSAEPGRVSLGLCEWALKASFSDLSPSASPHCGVPLAGKPQLRLSQESKAPSVKGVGPSPGLWASIEVRLGRGGGS